MSTKRLTFSKMEGCGNDYVYVDCFEQTVDDPAALSRRLSDRHFGVGGDGVILICPSEVADGRMRMFNADGSEGKMCGNGIRCVGRFLYERRGIRRERLTVETLSGVKTLTMDAPGGVVRSVTVDMGPPILELAQIPVRLEGSPINASLTVDGVDWAVTCLSMGNPHCVTFVEEVDSLDLERMGPSFEHHAAFPEQVNTEFVQQLPDGSLKMRVWERGSGETWACGTGACATAVAAILTGRCPSERSVTVHLRGGDLVIAYTGDTVTMTGPATFVFEGSCEA